jgi:RNA polymerase sigma-70 factor (ECF subfamily)
MSQWLQSNMASGFYLGNAIPESPLVTETSPVDDSDAALVRASQQGHTDAFGQLYQRYARMVHGILLAKVPRLEVEDLVHEVFLRALPRLRSLREASRFGGWLAAITRNMANDYHRQARVQIESHQDSHHVDTTIAPNSDVKTREAAEILESVRSLPEAYRETLILRLVEGMTGPEIAARTGLSHGSVRVNLHRGMQQLREKLARRAANSATRAQQDLSGEQ